MRFLSKLITATRDAAGEVVDGSPDTVVDVTDVWTFARALGTRDPNWQLVATEAGAMSRVAGRSRGPRLARLPPC